MAMASFWDQYFAIKEHVGAVHSDRWLIGLPYTQIYHHYPALESYFFEFEKYYDPMPVLHMMQRNSYIIPTFFIVAYMAFCYFGQRIMKDRKPFDLTGTLAAWNLLLAVFSFYGVVRTVPHMLHRIANVSFEETVCETPFSAYGGGACGLASALFIWSKIPELIDTVFIVLRKKPLIFLHWYHHVTVLAFCWSSYVTTAGAGLYFISMNYTVHSVMYFYYYLMAIKKVPKWFPTWIITLMQITQMLIGTGIVIASFYYYFYGGNKFAPYECTNQPANLLVGGVIYGSYFYLFVEFALKRFLFSSPEKKDKKPVKKE